MKRHVAHFVEKCHICAQVKAEHQKPYGALRQLKISLLKWEHIMMDLIEIPGLYLTFGRVYKNNWAHVLISCKVDDQTQILPIQDLRVDMNKKLVEEPVRIVDKKITKLHHKQIVMVLIEWKHILGSNLTWETEELIRDHYPYLFDHDQILTT
ncbi:uncharacterized protein [Rutidosis leptorrhynchoides]|uniref:uncharacterized protein n=1 Tax=Rutidosis leptorrhynchoides TaxID=125765 RepID=UPI003A99C0A3